jgi:outer membrane lipoprotein-sorting protein
VKYAQLVAFAASALVTFGAPAAAENETPAPAPAPATAAKKPHAAKPAKPAKPSTAAKPAPTAAPSQESDAAATEPTHGKLDKAEAIKRANAFFNASPVLTADFVQIGADGKRSEGKLYVQRAGRVRFEYAEPATMEVVSDGARVLVRDRKMKTEQSYFIEQTPLKFLLKEKIDLEHDVKLMGVSIDDAGAMISVEDSNTFGGTSKLKLLFDPKNFKLKQWQITDPQGYQTLLTLFNIDQKSVPNPALFKLEAKAKAE